MLRVLDIRLATSGGVLTAVRRIEYLILLGFCAYFGVLYAPLGLLAAAPMLLLALILVPGREAETVARERVRLDTIRALQDEGYTLHTRWMDLSDMPLSDDVASEQWELRRDTIIWMSRCETRLAQWPEVVGILTGRERKREVMEELDVCLLTLSRIRRLLSLSQSLKLPI